MDKLDSVIPQHETLINKPDKDLIYARKYWEKPTEVMKILQI